MWLAKLAEKGLLRPSFVPPAEVRGAARLHPDAGRLTRERTRHWQRLEKLLEDSLIKVSSVASRLVTASTRDMIEALIAGERDPQVLAGMARGRMKAKHAALQRALDGRFDEHHGELARILLDQIDGLTRQIDRLTDRIEALIAAIPAAAEPGGDGTGPGAGASGPASGGGAGAGVPQVRSPVRMDGRLATVHTAPPALGADTEDVLAALGFSQDEIQRLRHDRAI